MSADLRAVVERWGWGWGRTRELDVQRLAGALCIAVNGPSRRLEYVVAEPDADEFMTLVALVAGKPDVWLTVFADDVTSYKPLATDLETAVEGETFMSRHLDAAPVDRKVRIAFDGLRADAHLEIDHKLAATASVSVNHSDAVFDRVETMPHFQRRGLGTGVMNTLTAWAYEHGATHGLLAASTDGLMLYDRLGWQVVCPMISFRGVADRGRGS